MVFKTVATADEVQRARPHTLMGRAVNTRRAVPREWKSNPEANMRSKKLHIASIYGPQVGRKEDISDADIKKYFSRYGEVVRGSTGKKKGRREEEGLRILRVQRRGPSRQSRPGRGSQCTDGGTQGREGPKVVAAGGKKN